MSVILSDELRAEVIKLRRDFHQHPELGFEEYRTADIIEKYLRDLGLQTQRMAKTGVVGTLICKNPGKVVALRADMDALNIEEQSTHDYVSKNKGVMHACGHDGHIAIIMGIAKYLSSNKETLNGSYRFIFQPAEEGDGGAVPMIEEGCLKNPDVDYILGLHLKTDLDVGKFSITSGPVMAGICNFSIDVKGKGGHAAGPQNTIDPVVVAASIIMQSQTIISRNIDPFDTAVITFSTINGGIRTNIISEKVSMSGTIRTMSSETMNLVKNRLECVIKNTSAAFGSEYVLQFFPGYIPLVNDKNLTTKIRQIAEKEYGSDCITEQRSMGGDDFAYYGEKIPACYIRVGARNIKKGISYPNHHPMFDIDEESLTLAMDILIKVAVNNI